jgi:16S rRNA (adenine1518-N6/adenine1519-N6)-dimethyltransferase
MVIRLTRRELLPEIEYKLLRRVVKAAFGQRRKKLSNALKGTIPNEVLKEFGYSDLRAEQLAVDDFLKMAEYLELSD